MKLKDLIAKKISYLLPNRVMYWCLIRAYAYTTVHSFPSNQPDDIGFSMIIESWETKLNLRVDDSGNVAAPTVEHPNL